MEDDLTLLELVRGIRDDAFADQRVLLAEVLANKIADETDESWPKIESDLLVDIAKVSIDLAGHANSDAKWISLAILCNFTTYVSNSEVLTRLISENVTYSEKFSNMIEMFLRHNPQLEDIPAIELSPTDVAAMDWQKLDPWGLFGSTLCNITQINLGRQILTQRSKKYLPRMLPQFRSHNPTRRRGAIGSVRSCLFDKEEHWWLVDEVKVIEHILHLLVAPIPFTNQEKERMDPLLWIKAETLDQLPEQDPEILSLLLDCVLLLCQRRPIREILRKKRAYVVVRNLDYFCNDIDPADAAFLKPKVDENKLVQIGNADAKVNNSNTESADTTILPPTPLSIAASTNGTDNELNTSIADPPSAINDSIPVVATADNVNSKIIGDEAISIPGKDSKQPVASNMSEETKKMVSEKVYEIVNFLMRDESGDEPATFTEEDRK